MLGLFQWWLLFIIIIIIPSVLLTEAKDSAFDSHKCLENQLQVRTLIIKGWGNIG